MGELDDERPDVPPPSDAGEQAELPASSPDGDDGWVDGATEAAAGSGDGSDHSADQQLRENRDFFEGEAKRLREEGEPEAAALHEQSARDADELLGDAEHDASGVDGAESADDDGWEDARVEPSVADGEEDTRAPLDSGETAQREARAEVGETDADDAAEDERSQELDARAIAEHQAERKLDTSDRPSEPANGDGWEDAGLEASDQREAVRGKDLREAPASGESRQEQPEPPDEPTEVHAQDDLADAPDADDERFASIPDDVLSRIPSRDLDGMTGTLEYHPVAEEDMTITCVHHADADSTEMRWWGRFDELDSRGVMYSPSDVTAAIETARAEGRDVEPAVLRAAEEYLQNLGRDTDSTDATEHLALPRDWDTRDGTFEPRDTVYIRHIKKGDALPYIKSTVAPQESDLDNRHTAANRLPGGATQYYMLEKFAAPADSKRLGEILDVQRRDQRR